MDRTLGVVVVPVSDVDAAKTFYAHRVGFHDDHDTRIGEGQRVVQLTPPSSARTRSRMTPPPDDVGFVHFSDPDGDAWGVQQISASAS